MLLALNILIPIAAIVLAVWGAHSSEGWTDFRHYRWRLIVFGVIVAAATGWQIWLQTKNDDARSEHLEQENSRLQSSVDDLNRKNDGLQATVNAASAQSRTDSEKLIGTQRELIDSQKGQLKVSRQIVHDVTGGESFCYIVLLPDYLHNRPDMLRVSLDNKSATPVYDVTYSLMQSVVPGDTHIVEKFNSSIHGFEPIVYGAPGNGLATMTAYDVPFGTYMINIRARNGSLSETASVAKTNGGLSYETVVKREDGSILVNDKFNEKSQ